MIHEKTWIYALYMRMEWQRSFLTHSAIWWPNPLIRENYWFIHKCSITNKGRTEDNVTYDKKYNIQFPSVHFFHTGRGTRGGRWEGGRPKNRRCDCWRSIDPPSLSRRELFMIIGDCGRLCIHEWSRSASSPHQVDNPGRLIQSQFVTAPIVWTL